MTTLDLAVLLIIVLLLACLFLALYARQEHAQAQAQQRRAEEMYCWADAYQHDLAAAQHKLAAQHTRIARLQELNSLRLRQLLAANYPIIDRAKNWRHQRN
jgi:hypothetical protein